MTADLQKSVVYGHFILLLCSQMSELLHFICPHVVLWWFPAILRAFDKNKKNGIFWWPRTCTKMSLLIISHFFRFCSQLSELLQFRCPDVILWWFPAILRSLIKSKKNWSFRWPRTCRKMWFLNFSHVSSQMTKSLHFMCPDVILWWIFCHFKGFWEIQKKNEVFDDYGPAEKCRFWSFHTFCRFCSQMSELLQIRCPDVILWWFPAILRAFEKLKKKNWSFRWPRTCRKMSFLDISHVCRFCSQMSELLQIRCPDVILWWFPAILRAF